MCANHSYMFSFKQCDGNCASSSQHYGASAFPHDLIIFAVSGVFFILQDAVCLLMFFSKRLRPSQNKKQNN